MEVKTEQKEKTMKEAEFQKVEAKKKNDAGTAEKIKKETEKAHKKRMHKLERPSSKNGLSILFAKHEGSYNSKECTISFAWCIHCTILYTIASNL